jgi:copper chaperone NosL
MTPGGLLRALAAWRNGLLVAVSMLAGLLMALEACTSAPPGPAALDTKHEACAFCRMAISNARHAAQLVAPSEEPLFFDDVGCLAGHLRLKGPLGPGSMTYVADHRTKAWVEAGRAVYTKVPGLETPMGSHVVAHADAASRDADPDAKGGTPLQHSDVFGPAGSPTTRP